MSIGENVRTARKNKHLSQKALAEMVGVSELSIIRLEKGQREPRPSELEKLAAALDVPASTLMNSGVMPSDVTPVSMPRGKIIFVPLLSPEVAACCGDGIPVYGDIQNAPEESFPYTITELGGRYDEMRPPYAVRADGACLEKSRIFDGDILIFNPALEPRQGKVHIVCWDGALSAKKVVRRPDGSVQLFSDTDAFTVPAEEAADPERFAIWGPVVQSRHAVR